MVAGSGPSAGRTPFFMPLIDGQAGERAYQQMRDQLEIELGRAPNGRRIRELWTRRGNRDCVTTVGAPDPVSGGIVTAIFDMGPHQPFIVCRQQVADPRRQAFDVLGCNAYTVSEFT